MENAKTLIPDISSDESDTEQVEEIDDGLTDEKRAIGTKDVSELEFEVVDDKDKKKLSKKAEYHLNFWKTVIKYGSVIEGTNILPMKTPLMKKKWTDNIDKDDQFNLVEFIKNFEYNGKKIGVIVDLNFSEGGYYNWEICKRKNKEALSGKEYFKIKIEHGEVPSKKTCMRIYDILNKNLFKNHIVAVHCTYGINRTGYLLCHFLCSRLQKKPSEAMKLFEIARGYPLHKRILVEDLYDKFGEKLFEGRDPFNK